MPGKTNKQVMENSKATNMSKSLVFSLAFNGYQYIYRNEIKSHKLYADRNGFDYSLISKPAITGLSMECCWLKLVLILSALEAGYEWVFYVDADAEIKDKCPDFRSVEKPEKNVFMANGFSGRVNSGVIIVKNSSEAINFIKQTLREFNKELPEEDIVGWGENGHVIHFSKKLDGLEILPPEWNNNHTADLDDFVRHYSAGPMRQHHRRTFPTKVAIRLSRILQRFYKITGLSKYKPEVFPDRLMDLFKRSTQTERRIFKSLEVKSIFFSK